MILGDAGVEAGVIQLTTKNFDELVLKSNAVWMVEFFAPWYGLNATFQIQILFSVDVVRMQNAPA